MTPPITRRDTLKAAGLLLPATAAQGQLLSLTGSQGRAPGSSQGGGSYPENHDISGLPLDTETGFTDLNALILSDGYSDARIMYVSSSSGNDGTGAVYTQAQVEALGGTPVNPSGSPSAFETFAAARSNLRDNYPDVILLERGGSYSGSFTDGAGRSTLERRIIAAWGSGSRPLFDHTASTSLWSSAQYHLYADMEWTSVNNPDHASHDSGPNYNVEVAYLASHIWFENIQSAFVGLSFFTGSGAGVGPYDVGIYRSSISNCYSTSAHQQGIYAHVDGDTQGYFLVDESILDANGYYTGIVSGTVFNRNMYISQVPNAHVRKTISARGSTGDQLRRGGTWEENLSLKQPWTITFGHPESTDVPITAIARYNVTLDSQDIPGAAAHGLAITLGDRVATADVYENILAHKVSSTGNHAGFRVTSTELSDVDVYNNITYNWEGDQIWFWAQTVGSGVSVYDNDFIATDGGYAVQHEQTSDTAVTFSGNSYYSTETNPFDVDGSELNVASWESLTGETVTYGIPSYPDPDRTITTYMASLGETGLTYDEALDLFLERAKANDKGSLDYAYTAGAVIDYVREGFGLSVVP